MQSDVQIVRRHQDDSQLVHVEDSYEHEHVSNPLLTAHRLLQGKYPLVLTLALLCGALAAYATNHVVKDSYSSTGMVRVQPTLPFLLYQTEYQQEMPKYDAFVELQASLLKTEKVIDLAVQDPRWQDLAGPPSPANSDTLLANLKILHDSGTQLIEVNYTDPDPRKPAVAVDAVITAYLKLYSNTDEEQKAKTIEDLEAQKKTLNEQINEKEKQTLEISLKYNAVNLDQALSNRETAIADLKKQLDSVQLDIISQGADGTSATTRPTDISAEQWGLSDPEMSKLLQTRRNTQLDLSAKKEQMGDNNPGVKAAEHYLADLDLAVMQRKQFLDANVSPAANSGLALQRKKEALTRMLKAVEAEQHDIGLEKIRMTGIANELANLKGELVEANDRARKLEVESIGKGRVDAPSMGDRPKLDAAKRRMFTLAGGGGGAFAVIGAFLVFGLANRRMHRIADIQPDGAGAMNRGLRLLGAVPMLSADGSMGDNTPAAQAVHRIRTRLQIEAAAADHRVITVTSPASGNGKTSVITALGMSFASSGSRVLLLDCDLVGAGLTARLNGRVRRNIVDILRSQTNITEEQLAQAARVANKSSERFLQALIDFEYLAPDAVKRAVTTHKESNLGLLDALNGEPLNQCVAATRWPRLFVLPRGAATGSDAAQLSPLALRRLFQQARNTYDVVLVDTGPLFGSIEATLAASESDGTVLIVSRGESAAAVQAAVTDLKSMNCKVLGVVFNRAKAKDVASYGYSSKSQSRSRPVASLTEETEAAVASVPSTVAGRNGNSRSAVTKKMA